MSVSVIYTGNIRNLSLFLSQLDLISMLASRNYQKIQVIFATSEDEKDFERFILEIEKRKCRILRVPKVKEHSISYFHQAATLKAALDNVESNDFCIKMRPDVYCSPTQWNWFFQNIQSWPKYIGSEMNFESKIWVPFFHTTYPLFFGDHAFAGARNDLEKLLLGRHVAYQSLFSTPAIESHLRWIYGALEPGGLISEFIEHLDNFGKDKLGERYVSQVQQGLLGQKLQDMFLIQRLKWILNCNEMSFLFGQYFRSISEFLFLSKFDHNASHCFIDRFGPNYEIYCQSTLTLNSFVSNGRAWVLSSGNSLFRSLQSNSEETFRSLKEGFKSSERKMTGLIESKEARGAGKILVYTPKWLRRYIINRGTPGIIKKIILFSFREIRNFERKERIEENLY